VIHLIGVEHKVQWRQPRMPLRLVGESRQTNWSLYSSILEEVIEAFRPAVVAEELNQEFLDQRNNAESLLLCMTRRHESRTRTKIEHIFAEPDLAEKSAKGCKSEEQVEATLETTLHLKPTRSQIISHMIAHQHPIREGLWFDTIKKHREREMLFVCGDIHLYTFRRFLRDRGVHCRVAKRRIGVDAPCLSDYEGLKLAIENQMCSDDRCFCRETTQGYRLG
jgi:hypothetical protein